MKRDLDEALRVRLRLLLVAGCVAIVTELLWLCGIGKGVFTDFLETGNYLFSACLLAGAVLYLASDAPKKLRMGALGLGVVFEVAHAALRGDPWIYVMNVGAGLGLAALLVAAAETLSAREATARKEALLRLTETGLLAAFLVVSPLFVLLTVILHPTTYDAALFAADGAILGTCPSFALGRAFDAYPALRYVETAVYVWLPVATATIYAFERKRRPARLDLQVAFVIAGIVGCTLYHLLPVAGPRPAFRRFFPESTPDPEVARRVTYLAGIAFRNAIPSLHTTWALLIYWHARALGRAHQAFGAVWVVLTIVAMLGLGEHYLVDVFVTVPFAVALRALLTPEVPWRRLERWLPFAVGATLFAAWLVLFRAVWPGDWNPDVATGLAVAGVLVPLVLEHRLHTAAREPVAEVAPAPAPAEAAPRQRRTAVVVALIFFASGFAGLVYEVMFAKSLALVFGSTSTASSTVLATYMGGMALGSVLGGRIRTKSALRAYALCEVGVGFACAVAPLLIKAIRAAYIAAAAGGDPGRPGVVALQVALGALVLLPPTVMMGMTMPVLGRFFQKEDPSLGRSVGMLYAANTLGAAVGAFTTGYLLIPSLGIFHTTMLAVALNLGVALAAIRLDSKRGAAPADRDEPAAAEATPPPARDEAPRPVFAIGLSVLALGGVVTLALEVTYTHLLAIVVGNSTFAFSSMLTAFLVGLGGGAALGRMWLRKTGRYVLGVALAQGGVVLTVLVGVFLWNSVPSYFASYAGFPYARTFAISELIRFAVCGGLLVPPALCIGASYPLAVEAVVRGSRGDAVRALGTAGAANTAGNITGALLATFVLMPRLGSLRSLHVLMAVSLLLAAATLAGVARAERKVVGAVLAVGLLLFAVQPPSFDLTRLANGANVYFLAQGYGRTIDHAESSEGGLATVALSKDRDGTEVKTLLTNGKFEGDDSPVREMQAQYGLTLLPMLHGPPRGKALVIGLGTGVTARAVHDAGFAQVDVAELSGDIVDLARRHFQRVNGGVLEGNPAVRTFVTDGRNYLMLRPEQYDFIGLEISSIWFAGAASLYNREFYELTKARLAAGGVLQQWVQLHHLDVNDILTMLASLRSVYPRAWFYVAGGQGVAVACFHDCSPTDESLARIDSLESLRPGLALLGGRSAELLKFRVLTPEGLDKLLAAVGADPSDPAKLAARISTDDNLFLEYSTPRGNMRPYQASMDANVAYLRKFSPPDVLAGTHLSPEAVAPRKAPEPAP